MMDFTKEQLEEMGGNLTRLQEETITQIEGLKDASRPAKVDGSIGRVTRTEAIQQQQTALAGLHRARERLTILESVLRKIDDGSFGDCVSCGEPIAWERLKAKPDAKLCIECARGK